VAECRTVNWRREWRARIVVLARRVVRRAEMVLVERGREERRRVRILRATNMVILPKIASVRPSELRTRLATRTTLKRKRGKARRDLTRGKG